jgi:hypothetical protein
VDEAYLERPTMDRFARSDEERTMNNEQQIEKLAALFKQTGES